LSRPATARASRHPSLRIAVLAALVALLASACGNPPNPTPTLSASLAAPPPASSSAPASDGTACGSGDVTATGGPWGGAAGSRGSDIVVTNTSATSCGLPAGPTVAMVDQAGSVLLANTPPQSGAGPVLAAGGTIGFSLVISNWCDQQVPLPLHFGLALATAAVDIGGLGVTTLDDLPPCNGPGQPASISTTAWQPN